MKAVVIGAGVAGCIVTRALATLSQIEVICLERVDREDHSESGTGLNLGPNAIKALLSHDPKLHAAVLARSYPWKRWRTSLTDGTVLFDLALSRVAENDGVRIRWSELYAALRNEAQGLIRYGAKVTAAGYGADDDHRPFVEYTDSTGRHRIDNIDLLLATDGRYSLARESLAGAPVMRQHGVVIFRLLVPDTSAGLIDDYEQWFNGSNRLLAFRVPGDSVYIAGTFPIAIGAEIADSAKTSEFLYKLYAPAQGRPSAQCEWLIERICANIARIHWARLQESAPLFSDQSERTLFLGDSSHAMVPTLGQGATQAVEGACVAARLMTERWRNSPPDTQEIAALLRQFRQVREQRVQFVMNFSREASDTLGAGADPVAGTKLKTEPPFLAKLEQLYRNIEGA